MTENPNTSDPFASPGPAPAGGGGGAGFTAPHRGGTVLTMGILGLVVCGLLGLFGWLMGSKDLAEMDAGTKDPSGRGVTKAGKIMGIIGTCVVFPLQLIYIIVVVVAGASRF